MAVAHPRLATAYVIVGLLGGIVLYVMGFFYKIVPLLAWTVRYRGRMGREPVPTIAQTFSARVAHVQLALMALGVTLLASGTGAARCTSCAVGQCSSWPAWYFSSHSIGRVARGRGAA